MKRLFSLIIAVLTVMPGFALGQQRGRTITVTASNILSDVSERKKKQPALTAKELAAFGNDLIEKRGFDYHFDVCEILSARDRKSTANFLSARQPVSTINGRETLNLKLSVSNLGDGMCGECWTFIPSRQVSKREIYFVASGKNHRVQRPASFVLDEAELVDAAMEQILRRWQLPYQAVPVGISQDGTKLYVDFYPDYELDNLVLEVADDGRLAFRDRAEMGLQREGVLISNHPKDPGNAYLSFIRFQAGDKSYIVRFSAPCT